MYEQVAEAVPGGLNKYEYNVIIKNCTRNRNTEI